MKMLCKLLENRGIHETEEFKISHHTSMELNIYIQQSISMLGTAINETSPK
jgi:hypothetical protein